MTMEQMLGRLDALVMMRAGTRLHQAKAVTRRSEGEELDAAIKATRDLLLTLIPHKRAIWALMQGEALAPMSEIRTAARHMAEEGGE
jgi:hypothetical protein